MLRNAAWETPLQVPLLFSSGVNGDQGGRWPSPHPGHQAGAREDWAAGLFGLTEALCTVGAKHFKDRLAVSTPVLRWEGESPSQGAPDCWGEACGKRE